MSSRSTLTLPAHRLRKGDMLPAYGTGARVARPPVVSRDGQMVTVIVDSGNPETAQLARVPIDRDLKVVRPDAAPEMKFVRTARMARSSGTKVLVLDLTHPDSEIQPVDDNRFATLCAAHGTIRFHAGVSNADAQAHHPEEWCTPCTEETRARNHQRVYGTKPIHGLPEQRAGGASA